MGSRDLDPDLGQFCTSHDPPRRLAQIWVDRREQKMGKQMMKQGMCMGRIPQRGKGRWRRIFVGVVVGTTTGSVGGGADVESG